MELKLSRPSTLLAALISLTLLALAAWLPLEGQKALLGEEGFIEIISALAYLTAIVLFALAGRRSHSPYRYHFLMWALLAFIFFGEETSWLQHYLGFETPESIKAVNAQSEFNLHNLDILHGRKLIKDGQFVNVSWTHLFLSSQMLFQLGFAGYFFGLPLLRTNTWVNQWLTRLGFPKLHWSLVLPVFFAIVACLVFTLLNRSGLSKSFWGEIRELVFALGIFSLAAIAYARTGSANKES